MSWKVSTFFFFVAQLGFHHPSTPLCMGYSVVLWRHTGGLRFNTKESVTIEDPVVLAVAAELVRKGFAVFNLHYSLVETSPKCSMYILYLPTGKP